MNTRLDRLRNVMRELEFDAFLVQDEHNRRYLSGFTGSSGVLLVLREGQYLVTDFRYYEQMAHESPGWTLWKQKKSLQEATADLLAEVMPLDLGFEGDVMTVSNWTKFDEDERLEDIGWYITEGIVKKLRATKEAEEMELIRRAQAITNQAGAQLPRLIEPGKSERQVAWELESLMRQLGADGAAFSTIVASGPNSALPHHRAGERVIQENEMVLVDFGALRDGYHSDCTRTFFTGEPTEKYREIYNIVLESQERVERTLKADFNSKAGDALARDFIKEHGYGDNFGHSLGHGVGLDIHEMPTLSYRAKEKDSVALNSIVTIEPGIYLPDWGGIRIEDMVLVLEDRVEILTDISKDVDAWRKGR